jgi:hypothetical protein
MRSGVDVVYPFLSDEWVEEARRIRAEYEDRAPAPPLAVRMNIVVADVPTDAARIDAHLDTTSGMLELEVGHLPDPDVTVTLEYATARAIFVEGDMQTAMGAFLGGRIKVDGDITKLLSVPAAGTIDPVMVEVFTRLRDITA